MLLLSCGESLPPNPPEVPDAREEQPVSATAPLLEGWITHNAPGQDRIYEGGFGLLQGTNTQSPKEYVLVRTLRPPNERINQYHHDECGGTLLTDGEFSYIDTAAHCVEGPFTRVEWCVEPVRRPSSVPTGTVCGLAHRTYIDANYDNKLYAFDRAIIPLGVNIGGIPVEAGRRPVVSVGGQVTVYGMGVTDNGSLATQVQFCKQTVTKVRPFLLETAGYCHFASGDSGSGLFKDGVHVGTVSHTNSAREQYYAIAEPDKTLSLFRYLKGN